MTGSTGERTVQIDHMQAFGAPLLPDGGHGYRIVRINRRPPEVPLGQTHTTAILQINGGNDNHPEIPP